MIPHSEPHAEAHLPSFQLESSLDASRGQSGWVNRLALRHDWPSELASAECSLAAGDVERAFAEFQRIRQAALRTGDGLLAEVVCQHLANGCRQIGDFISAAIWQQQSIAHRLRSSTEKQHSPDSNLGRLACELTSLGSDAFQRRDFDLAETYWQRALAIERWRGDWEGQALDLGNLGLLAAARGDYPQGIRRLRTTYRLHCLMFDDLQAGIDLLNLTELFRLTGDWPRSLKAVNRATQHFNRVAAAHWLERCQSRRQELERIVQLQELDPRRN